MVKHKLKRRTPLTLPNTINVKSKLLTLFPSLNTANRVATSSNFSNRQEAICDVSSFLWMMMTMDFYQRELPYIQ